MKSGRGRGRVRPADPELAPPAPAPATEGESGAPRRRSKNYEFGEREFGALLRQVLVTTRSRRDLMLFSFLGLTGLRVGEAINVKVEDLTLRGRRPSLRVRTLQRRVRPAAGWDVVGLESALRDQLRDYIRRAGLRPSGRIFPFSRRNAQRLFYLYARRAGLEGFSIQALRHYRGGALYRASGSVEVVQRELRYLDWRTAAVYARGHARPKG